MFRVRSDLRFRFGTKARGHGKLDVCQRRHPGHERMPLEDDGTIKARSENVLAVDDDVAGRRLIETGEDIEDRRLAATRMPDDADELALGDRKPDILEDRQLAPSTRLGEALAQTFDTDEVCRHAAALFRVGDGALQPAHDLIQNHADQTDFVTSVARSAFGEKSIDTTVPPTMGAEDFSFMLEERPGSYIFMGNGDSAGLHHPAYEFNDAAIPVGMTYWAGLIETAMPAR